MSWIHSSDTTCMNTLNWCSSWGFRVYKGGTLVHRGLSEKLLNFPSSSGSCSAEWPRHCPGWTAHPRRVTTTVSFLFKTLPLYNVAPYLNVCRRGTWAGGDESCRLDELDALTPPLPLQWSTSNWSRSQRWLSPRAAARASTPRLALPSARPPTRLLSTNSLSLSGHCLHPMARRHQNRGPRLFFLSLFFSLLFFPPAPPPHSYQTQVTFQSNCVDVHHRVETNYLEKII